MLIPRLVSKIKNDDSIILTGYDGIKINPIYVDDAKKLFKIPFRWTEVMFLILGVQKYIAFVKLQR